MTELNNRTPPLPWWAAGLLLGLVQVLAIALVKPMEVSKPFVVIDTKVLNNDDGSITLVVASVSALAVVGGAHLLTLNVSEFTEQVRELGANPLKAARTQSQAASTGGQ